jgi:hypothetical protein
VSGLCPSSEIPAHQAAENIQVVLGESSLDDALDESLSASVGEEETVADDLNPCHCIPRTGSIPREQPSDIDMAVASEKALENDRVGVAP